MLTTKSGIYKILNKANGKFYIGSAKNFYVRWHLHRSQLANNRHKNSHLQSAWSLYGEASFEFVVLEETSLLKEREQYWLDATKCYYRDIGYNLRKIADTNLGLRWSDASKLKMSNSAKGKIISDETRAKMSLSRMGHEISEITRNKIRIANIGKPKTDEAKKRMSEVDKSKYRKLDKWPCHDGCECKCADCRSKKNSRLKLWRSKKAA